MVQLNYDEIRLLRELKNSERRIAGSDLDVGLERLVKEGYPTRGTPIFPLCLCFSNSHAATILKQVKGSGGGDARPTSSVVRTISQ